MMCKNIKEAMREFFTTFKPLKKRKESKNSIDTPSHYSHYIFFVIVTEMIFCWFCLGYTARVIRRQ
jgi:hypothetical protein